MKTTLPPAILPLASSILLTTVIFAIDLQLPLGVAGGVPYVAVILASLWLHSRRYVIGFAIICSILVLTGLYFSPQGGELWKVLINRGLAIFAVWATAILALKWEASQKRVIQIRYEREKEQEKEKIYLATIHGAQHVTNNLLNQLKLVQIEIENQPGFDRETATMFNGMLIEAQVLLRELSSVKPIEAENIKQSVYPKPTT